MDTSLPLRRAPKQERGERRIAAILEAAAEEFARVGFEATTTNAIAKRANTSVGSLYQFFDDKEAILAAVTEHYLDELRALHLVVLHPDAGTLPLPEFFDQLVDRLAEFHTTHPGFVSLFYGSPTSPHLAAAAERLQRECIAGAMASMAARMPQLDPARLRLFATINVTTVKGLLPLAVSSDAATGALILRELKNLLIRYMDGVQAELARER